MNNNDLRTTITCNADKDGTTIKVLSEQNFVPIFKETFLSNERPLPPRLIDRKIILNESIGKTGSEQILSNVLQLMKNGIKYEGKIYTQNENDLKSQITDFPIIEKFQEIIGIKFDWSKFHNRREFRKYFVGLLGNTEISV